MSTRTITFSLKLGGVLTAATSVVLSDPTGTFGVKRDDTDVVVVAAGTVMTSSTTGVYSYTFTEPAAGLSYTAYVEWVYGGETYRVERLLAAIPASDTGPTLRLAKWSVVTAPTAAPVTWAEAKAHLRLDDNIQQAYVETLIDAATDFAQDRLASSFMLQTLRATFYDGERLALPRGPVVEIQSVVDSNGDALSDFETINSGHTTTVLPDSTGAGYPLSVTYTAGYATAAAIPAGIRMAILVHVATLFENRESVSEKGKMPVPHSYGDFLRTKSRFSGVG